MIDEPWVNPHPAIAYTPYMEQIYSQYKGNLFQIIRLDKWELFNEQLTSIMNRNEEFSIITDKLRKSFKSLIKQWKTKKTQFSTPEKSIADDELNAANPSFVSVDLPSDNDAYENGKLNFIYWKLLATFYLRISVLNNIILLWLILFRSA